MDRISELSSADEVGGQDTRRTVVLVTERAEDVAQKQQQQPLPDRAWSRASVVSDRLRKILRRGGDAGDVAGGGGSGSDSVVLRRYASTAEAADAVVAAAGVGADVEVDTAKERRADDDRRLVADTPDAKRLKDGQVQVRHYDPVMQRMGNFLRSNAEKRRVTRGVRERLRRGEHSNGIYEIDPNFAIRPDEAAKIRMWRGKDYVNWILKEPVRLHLPEEELVDRGRVPRMPWHDIGCVVGGNAARDVARHFIERWNFTVKSKSNCQLPLLMPKSLKPEPAGPDNSDLEPDADGENAASAAKQPGQRRTFLGLLDRLHHHQPQQQQQQQQHQYQVKSDLSQTDSNSKPSVRQPPLPFKSIAPKSANRVNVLRSLGMWSGGIEEPETSVLSALCDAIDNSEYYVYIENQFFISCADETLGRKWPVQNPIASRLVQRIVRANREGRKFRVYLVLPLLPQFEGDVAESPSSADSIKKILHHTYACLCRSESSMMAQLSDAGIQASDYLSVCALRTWGQLAGGELVSELIYVHSKLMIADDRVAIIGSANINDRSLLGYRDSEIAVRFEDSGSDLAPADWQAAASAAPAQSGSFCGSLRRCLMREHLGLSISDPANQALADPTSDQFFHEVWSATARRNTEIFEQVFHCYPTDRASNYKELRDWVSEPSLAATDREQAVHQLETEVRGFLVEFPLNFLDGVSLDFQVGRISSASLLPLITWL
ncbi:hypothetical protein BOX15_Mlig021482g1 [Macrostomum lignano]|uniref:phospholipase D n=1 Tax=Macrostomum lignano TaxID=282301 RepID=A0A267DIQ0_9PLAT|nr:hypothetical protein BOX15_Mlig021482g1 [Macrostomum lignano]